MKKIISVILCIALLFNLTACNIGSIGTSDSNTPGVYESTDPMQTPSVQQTETPTQEPAEAPTESPDADADSETISLAIRKDSDSSTSSTTLYKVSFETNGGDEIDAISVSSGSVIENLQTPIKSGYVFEGWYTNPNLESEYYFYDVSPITSNITLYAKYSQQLVTSGNTVTEYYMEDMSESTAIYISSQYDLTQNSNFEKYVTITSLQDVPTFTVTLYQTGVYKLTTTEFTAGGVYEIALSGGLVFYKETFASALAQDIVSKIETSYGEVQVISDVASSDDGTVDLTGVTTFTLRIAKDDIEVVTKTGNEIIEMNYLDFYSIEEFDNRNTSYKAVAYQNATNVTIIKAGDIVSICEEIDTGDEIYSKVLRYIKIVSVSEYDFTATTIAGDFPISGYAIEFIDADENDIYYEVDIYQNSTAMTNDILSSFNTEEMEQAIKESDGAMQIAYLLAAALDSSSTVEEISGGVHYDASEIDISSIFSSEDLVSSVEGSLQEANQNISVTSVETKQTLSCETSEVNEEIMLLGYSDNAEIVSSTQIELDAKSLIDGLKVAIEIGPATNTNFGDIFANVPNKDDDYWLAVKVTMTYEATIKGKVKVQAEIEITEYLAVTLQGGKSGSDFDYAVNIYNQTDMVMTILVCSTNESEGDDNQEDNSDNNDSSTDENSGVEWTDVSVEITGLISGEEETTNDNIVAQMLEFLESEGDYIELYNKEIFATAVNVAYVLDVNFSANFVVKFCFAAGIKTEFTYLDATQVGIKGNTSTGYVEAYSNSIFIDRFSFDLYVAGHLGVRIGLAAELTVSFTGLAKLGELGAGFEMGIYAKLYGYAHYNVTAHAYYYNGEQLITQSFNGGYYAEMGLYLELYLVASSEIFDAQAKYVIIDWEFPLFSLGDKYVFMEIDDSDHYESWYENMEIYLDGDSTKVSDFTTNYGSAPAFYGIYLDITTGNEVSRKIDPSYITYSSNSPYIMIGYFGASELSAMFLSSYYTSQDQYFDGTLNVKYTGSILNPGVSTTITEVDFEWIAEDADITHEEAGQESTITYLLHDTTTGETYKLGDQIAEGGKYYTSEDITGVYFPDLVNGGYETTFQTDYDKNFMLGTSVFATYGTITSFAEQFAYGYSADEMVIYVYGDTYTYNVGDIGAGTDYVKYDFTTTENGIATIVTYTWDSGSSVYKEEESTITLSEYDTPAFDWQASDAQLSFINNGETITAVGTGDNVTYTLETARRQIIYPFIYFDDESSTWIGELWAGYAGCDLTFDLEKAMDTDYVTYNSLTLIDVQNAENGYSYTIDFPTYAYKDEKYSYEDSEVELPTLTPLYISNYITGMQTDYPLASYSTSDLTALEYIVKYALEGNPYSMVGSYKAGYDMGDYEATYLVDKSFYKGAILPDDGGLLRITEEELSYLDNANSNIGNYNGTVSNNYLNFVGWDEVAVDENGDILALVDDNVAAIKSQSIVLGGYQNVFKYGYDAGSTADTFTIDGEGYNYIINVSDSNATQFYLNENGYFQSDDGKFIDREGEIVSWDEADPDVDDNKAYRYPYSLLGRYPSEDDIENNTLAYLANGQTVYIEFSELQEYSYLGITQYYGNYDDIKYLLVDGKYYYAGVLSTDSTHYGSEYFNQVTTNDQTNWVLKDNNGNELTISNGYLLNSEGSQIDSSDTNVTRYVPYSYDYFYDEEIGYYFEYDNVKYIKDENGKYVSGGGDEYIPINYGYFIADDGTYFTYEPTSLAVNTPIEDTLMTLNYLYTDTLYEYYYHGDMYDSKIASNWSYDLRNYTVLVYSDEATDYSYTSGEYTIKNLIPISGDIDGNGDAVVDYSVEDYIRLTDDITLIPRYNTIKYTVEILDENLNSTSYELEVGDILKDQEEISKIYLNPTINPTWLIDIYGDDKDIDGKYEYENHYDEYYLDTDQNGEPNNFWMYHLDDDNWAEDYYAPFFIGNFETYQIDSNMSFVPYYTYDVPITVSSNYYAIETGVSELSDILATEKTSASFSDGTEGEYTFDKQTGIVNGYVIGLNYLLTIDYVVEKTIPTSYVFNDGDDKIYHVLEGAVVTQLNYTDGVATEGGSTYYSIYDQIQIGTPIKITPVYKIVTEEAIYSATVVYVNTDGESETISSYQGTDKTVYQSVIDSTIAIQNYTYDENGYTYSVASKMTGYNNAMTTAEITITWQCEPTKYTATFTNIGELDTTILLNVQYGDKIDISQYIPNSYTVITSDLTTVYTFAGWDMDEDNLADYDANGEDKNQSTIYTVDGDAVFNALWTKDEVCVVSYDNTLGESISLQSVASGEMFTLPMLSTKTTQQYTYKFVGWKSESETIDGGSKTSVSVNTRFTAVWEIATNQYDVTFTFIDADGGEIITTKTLDYGTALDSSIIPSLDDYADKYIVSTWYSSDYGNASLYKVTQDASFQANASYVYVNYYVGGKLEESQPYKIGDEVTVKDIYANCGDWRTLDNEIVDGKFTMPAENISIYANYLLSGDFTITDSTGSYTLDTNTYETSSTLEDASGFVFNKDLGVLYIKCDGVTVSGTACDITIIIGTDVKEVTLDNLYVSQTTYKGTISEENAEMDCIVDISDGNITEVTFSNYVDYVNRSGNYIGIGGSVIHLDDRELGENNEMSDLTINIIGNVELVHGVQTGNSTSVIACPYDLFAVDLTIKSTQENASLTLVSYFDSVLEIYGSITIDNVDITAEVGENASRSIYAHGDYLIISFNEATDEYDFTTIPLSADVTIKDSMLSLERGIVADGDVSFEGNTFGIICGTDYYPAVDAENINVALNNDCQLILDTPAGIDIGLEGEITLLNTEMLYSNEETEIAISVEEIDWYESYSYKTTILDEYSKIIFKGITAD